jgi:REP element-mobilizing transposase RayT
VVDRGASSADGEIGRAALFPTPLARDGFVGALAAIAREHPVEIHAYCAMETHFHVLARADEADLRRAFTTIVPGESPATEGVRLRRLAFGRHLLLVTRYIHRNPVEAGLVRRPGDWRWSSYLAYVDPRRQPPWLRTAAVLGWLGSVGGRHRYRALVEEKGTFRFSLTFL